VAASLHSPISVGLGRESRPKANSQEILREICFTVNKNSAVSPLFEVQDSFRLSLQYCELLQAETPTGAGDAPSLGESCGHGAPMGLHFADRAGTGIPILVIPLLFPLCPGQKAVLCVRSISRLSGRV
jgi:hypothetical protein